MHAASKLRSEALLILDSNCRELVIYKRKLPSDPCSVANYDCTTASRFQPRYNTRYPVGTQLRQNAQKIRIYLRDCWSLGLFIAEESKYHKPLEPVAYRTPSTVFQQWWRFHVPAVATAAATAKTSTQK